MTREAFRPPRLSVRPLHHQYEARLSKAMDENSYPPSRHPRSGSSPLPHKNPKRSKHIYSDRFIPSRLSTNLDTGFDLHPEPSHPHDVSSNQNTHDATPPPANLLPQTSTISGMGLPTSSSTPQQTASSVKGVNGSHVNSSSYSMLLKSELLGLDTPGALPTLPSDFFFSSDASDLYDPFSPPIARAMMSGASAFNFSSWSATGASGSVGARSLLGRRALASLGSQNMLKFKAPRQSFHSEGKTSIPFSGLSGSSSAQLLAGDDASGANYARRKFPKVPFKVLDAPALQDDFYLNLVDWSSANVLAVGLGAAVYLWSASTGKVSKLCDLGAADAVTSVAWSQRGTHVSVGTNSGEVQIWEVATGKKVRTMDGHVARVGTLAWSSQLIASGSRDRTIYLRDVRAPEPFTHRLTGHKQEVCGLKWSFDNQKLASGGNDNKLFVWSLPGSNAGSLSSSATIPVVRFSDHTAAVKAIAWSPHQNGLLASGGGTADRCIRFWNTQTQTALHAVDTGSQVCNLMWSKTVNEVVSTHGYSLNQIIVWKYPTMTKLATLTGHTCRVLYLAMSPDGQTIVTGAGDETLRFWNAFPSSRSKAGGGRLGATMMLPLGAGSEIR